ncbi:MAG TPA: response regulator [Tepidisphaeraceae bacterium]|jgi:DNA-binding NtrC family response regulator|nr:response regulator [Tepidisphaeraceae bacterium]
MSSNLSASSPHKVLTSGKDVLVVEDDPRVRKMLSEALTEMGFVATFSGSAESAEKVLAEKSFDVLILDLNLPGVGGIEFLETIRQQQMDVPVIILTGFGDLDAARKAIHLDVVEFLSKPCTLGTLETAMSRARQRRKTQIVSEAAASTDPTLKIEPVARVLPAFPQEDPNAGVNEEEANASMEDVERRHILSVLRKHQGNRSATAAELGISVRKLYYRLGEYHRKGLFS